MYLSTNSAAFSSMSPGDPGRLGSSRVELTGSNRPEFCAASTARGLSHEKRSLRRPIMSGTSVAPLCGMGLLSLLGSIFAILLVGETIENQPSGIPFRLVTALWPASRYRPCRR